MTTTLIRWLTSPAFLRPLCVLLRKLPMLRLKESLWVTRHADVVEVLRRDGDFGIDPAATKRFRRVIGPSFLAMDRSPEYEYQVGLLRQVVRSSDLPWIRDIAADHIAGLMDGAWSGGRIDVVWLARMVPVRLVGSYFGVTGPDEVTMLRWIRGMFTYVFYGQSPEEAMESAGALHGHLKRLIEQRKAALAAGAQGHDDVLGRLLRLQREDPSITDDTVRCNLVGLVMVAVEETAKAVVYAIDELLRRPAICEDAQKAAMAGDRDALKQQVFEAMRFKPNNPWVLRRFSARETTVAAGSRWERRVRAGSRLLVVTLSAMFDESAFHQPTRFRTDRSLDDYLIFGHGVHTCFGRMIAAVVVPEVTAAVLRLPNLRRAPGRQGRISYEGLLPSRLILESDDHTRWYPQAGTSPPTGIWTGAAMMDPAA